MTETREELEEAIQTVLAYGERTRLMITSTRLETHEFEVAAQVVAKYAKRIIETGQDFS